MCTIFYPSHHARVSERSADLTVVRCGEMEGGEIFGTKAAKCFCPLHAICALVTAGSSTNCHPLIPSHMSSLCLGRLLLSYLLQLVLRETFPTQLRLGGAPPLCVQQATVCLSATITSDAPLLPLPLVLACVVSALGS